MKTRILLMAVTLLLAAGALRADSLEQAFQRPPNEARPWVYWFWNNANVTREGITADLEAMKRVGIGGVIIMDVFERFAPPRGTAEFMGAEWRELFRFAVGEANRLGLEVNMTNGPGWTGSSGPWITPELSMQVLVRTNTRVVGPTNLSLALPRPALPPVSRDGWDSAIPLREFYRDIAVLAWPATTLGAVPREQVIDLTARLDANGHLNWPVPPGDWIVQRIGHTSTGMTTRPPVVGGNGLECDKLSRAAMDAHFAGMMGRLITEVGPVDGRALVATHIDSWEVKGQNWTLGFREEFLKRRGYDPIPFLPNVLDRVRESVSNQTITRHPNEIGAAGMAARFRWDFQQTLSELLAENYVGRLAELAHEQGMRLSIEGYSLSFGDEATYTARADEPMSEFWMNTGWASRETLLKGRQMASVAHTTGKRIVGAEAFTSDDNEKWLHHPATIKSLGDFEFCQGINRFVIHRYAHQPYLDRAPGATMGPWGLHYERTQTWWELSGAWHEYLARCQFLLRQGQFVADLCYLRPEAPNQNYFDPTPAPPAGYRYDEISAEALIERMSVKGGRLVLPDGMSYRLLVVPPANAMTPALARKLNQLVAAGATVLLTGAPPQTSPSLAGFPECDEVVAGLTREIWGDGDGKRVTEHAFGQGRVIRGRPLADVLTTLQAPADFASATQLNWIHRRTDDTEIYFVANPASVRAEAQCRFRVTDLQPELWDPETGEVTLPAAYESNATGVSIPLFFEPAGSVFVIFRKAARAFDPVVRFTRDGEPVFASLKPDVIEIQTATYGVPGDAERTRDVRGKLQALIRGGVNAFQVAELARGDDPAYGIVKTLVVDYTLNGRPQTISGQDPDRLILAPVRGAAERAAEVRRGVKGNWRVQARLPGRYELKLASGRTTLIEITNVPAPREITGAWDVTFPPRWGAPERITLDSLTSWSASSDPGVKYFSGTATYHKTFEWNGDMENGRGMAQTWLELGDVQVMARVAINGHDLGTLWKPPFRVNVTSALQPGPNTLELRVANLWPNRMIGDAALAETNRFTWSSWEPFKGDEPLLESGLLGPVRIVSVVQARQ